MTFIGYARVSTLDQDLALPLDALGAAGCTKVFEERASGARADRPGLRLALDCMREGDVLLVWKLDRLGRSLAHMIETIGALEQRSLGSARLPRRSTPPRPAAGSYFTCSARSAARPVRARSDPGADPRGPAAAAARGRKGGRKPVIDAEKLARARSMIGKGLTVREAANRLMVGKTALYEALRLAAGEITLAEASASSAG